jgi:hypothetical protein
MYYLSICAVVRDEGRYLREWLEYHILQGVEHFFIYNNRSVDNTEDILKEYQSYDFVTYENMDDVPVQFKAYNRCLREHGKKSRWISFTDIDEFLVRNSNELQFASALEPFEKHPGIALSWQGFGSNGHIEFTSRLVLNRFTRRGPKPDKHVKTICQPAMTVCVGQDPHTFYYKHGSAVNELFKKLPKNYAHSEPTAKNLWINHYWVKSRGEFLQRRLLGNAGDGRPYEKHEETFAGQDTNEVEDLTAQFWANSVEKMIEYRGK